LRQQLATQGILEEDTQLEALRIILKYFLQDYEPDFHSENPLETMDPPHELGHEYELVDFEVTNSFVAPLSRFAREEDISEYDEKIEDDSGRCLSEVDSLLEKEPAEAFEDENSPNIHEEFVGAQEVIIEDEELIGPGSLPFMHPREDKSALMQIEQADVEKELVQDSETQE